MRWLNLLLVVNVSGKTQSMKGNSNRTSEFKFSQKQYSFKDEQVVTIFHLLNKGNKLNLPEVQCTDEVGHTNDSNYCLFHRMVHHPTSRCFSLNDKIQALIETSVLTLKSRPKGKIVVREGVMFVSPHNHVLPRAFLLFEPCSNNVVQYNALLISLQLPCQMGA